MSYQRHRTDTETWEQGFPPQARYANPSGKRWLSYTKGGLWTTEEKDLLLSGGLGTNRKGGRCPFCGSNELPQTYGSRLEESGNISLFYPQLWQNSAAAQRSSRWLAESHQGHGRRTLRSQEDASKFWLNSTAETSTSSLNPRWSWGPGPVWRRGRGNDPEACMQCTVHSPRGELHTARGHTHVADL